YQFYYTNAANSKAYIVYNLSSKKVEETLNLRYLEDKPNVQGLGQKWYFDFDYLTDSLGYTRFKTNTPTGTQATNINAGTQDDDSESEYDEQAILVPSFPSNSFSSPKVNEVSATIENHLDYAKELARLHRQEQEAHSATEKYGFKFSNETAEMLHQAKIKTRRKLSASFGDPAASESVPAVFILGHADNSTLPPGHSLGSSEHSTRFPSPSDLGNHQPKAGIFSSSSFKKIFKYLKRQPNLGLWYPRDSPFQLEAYSDSDYAGSHGDRKSTTGGCQFLVAVVKYSGSKTKC
nr:uncharacterized mitochondrial protein AtMg00810-like [Tanacetum cinerariifolium]